MKEEAYKEVVEDDIPLLTDKIPTDADLHFNCHGQHVPPEKSDPFSKWIDEIWDDEDFPLNPDGSHNAASYAHMAAIGLEIEEIVEGGDIESLAKVSEKLTDLAGVIDETDKGKK